ncbi:uncharacterized protein LOC142539131 [Primulina tabacum]|uniref:uncharacterized protein LOC142539131 n=1 Tax=Primulina tabacum TaxID=48773 RepID=UPI003F59AB55
MPPKKKSKRNALSSSHGYDKHKFWNSEAQRIYESTLARPIIQERGIDMSSPDYSLVKEIMKRGWVELAKSPADAIISIVREFYANLRVKHEDHQVLVRGKIIVFDLSTINMVYDLPILEADEYTEYIAGDIDYTIILKDLCINGAEWRTNQGIPVTLKKSEMLRDPNTWASFILARILPSTHQTEITKDKAALVHAITTGQSIDLGKIIHGSILRTSTGLITTGLPCPHIITELCQHASVTWGPEEQVLKAKAPIIVYRFRRFYGQAESIRRDERAAYNQRAKDRQEPRLPALSRVPLGDRITKIEQAIKAQREELAEHKQVTTTFMAYMVNFTSVLAQHFPPTTSTDAPFPPPPPWTPQHQLLYTSPHQSIDEAIHDADNDDLNNSC